SALRTDHDECRLELLFGGAARGVERHRVFFFQAEDGIRDKLVTGVQTCALPISPAIWVAVPQRANSPTRLLRPCKRAGRRRSVRSEERRVGKECRTRGSSAH